MKQSAKCAGIGALAGVAAAAGWTAPALSQAPSPRGTATSAFSALDLKTCKRVPASQPDGDRDGGRWQCGGPKGYEVLFAEGDLRQFLGYGAKARAQRASKQTLGPFNSIFKDQTDRATIQWRGSLQGGRLVPYASIVRYYVDTGDDGPGQRRRSQVLVVTKLGPPDSGEACHMAYVDAVANKDAIGLATEAADARAGSFTCGQEPAILGAKGVVPPMPSTRT